MTFACTAVDGAAIDPARVDVVGVTGNSMGWYTALHVAGALDLAGAARLVETMGAYQADHVVGAQLVYPIVGDDWRPAPPLAAAVAEALAHPGVFVSIRLGGAVVLGVDATGSTTRAACSPRSTAAASPTRSSCRSTPRSTRRSCKRPPSGRAPTSRTCRYSLPR